MTSPADPDDDPFANYPGAAPTDPARPPTYQPRHGDTGELNRLALLRMIAEEEGIQELGADDGSGPGYGYGSASGSGSGPGGGSGPGHGYGSGSGPGSSGGSASASARGRGGRPDRGGQPHGFLAEAKSAVTLRSALLTVAVVGLGLGFILSYVGGLHNPAPQNLPFGVVAPQQVQAQTIAGLSTLPGEPLSLRLLPNAAAAQAQVRDRALAGALVVNAGSPSDTLYVASAAGPSAAAATTKIIQSADSAQGRTIVVQDLVPVSAQDTGGLASFYLAVGWTVTGYLIASMLGVSAGTRPATATRAVIRLLALAGSALATGLGGAWLAQHVLGALPGPYWPLVLTGSLLVFGAGALTMAMEIMFGIAGIGLAVLLFVILGNPAAGGAYSRSLIPPFWRSIGAFLPPGAGTDAARSSAYFGGADMATPLWILAAYGLVGAAASLIGAALLRPGGRSDSRGLK